MKVKSAVLCAVVRLNGKGDGETIRREASTLCGREINFGELYEALEELSTQRLVVVRQSDERPEHGDRPSNHYTATPKGQSAYAKEFPGKL
jgi:DNA-binding PadR family transcriptional regulator